MIGCDLSTALCKAQVPLFTNKELLAINQDLLGVQAKRVGSTGPLVIPKAGVCQMEELPQNSIIAPCRSGDPLQTWALHPDGKVVMSATGECLQLDSGQGGDCDSNQKCNGGLRWQEWAGNAASAMCDDPASCCGVREQLWSVTGNGTGVATGIRATAGPVTNQLTGQCLTVHAGGMHNVGVYPCSDSKKSLQSWTWTPATTAESTSAAEPEHDNAARITTGQLVLAVSPPGEGKITASSRPYCLTRTDDVAPGQVEVWAGPLAGGEFVLMLFNRDMPTTVNITATWEEVGLPATAEVTARDVVSHTDLGKAVASFTAAVEVHGVRVLRLTPTTSSPQMVEMG